MGLFDVISGFFSDLGSVLTIQFAGGVAKCTTTKVTGACLRDVESIMEEFEVNEGFMRKSGNGTWSFSRSIPESAQQRLRNVLASI